MYFNVGFAKVLFKIALKLKSFSWCANCATVSKYIGWVFEKIPHCNQNAKKDSKNLGIPRPKKKEPPLEKVRGARSNLVRCHLLYPLTWRGNFWILPYFLSFLNLWIRNNVALQPAILWLSITKVYLDARPRCIDFLVKLYTFYSTHCLAILKVHDLKVHLLWK